ncbi:MAG: epoxyqueuosine reductase QueH [Candidatus Omnitrophica bacterium]|nr:epoxyqueuosine reductase QueH [Candidatus Omnitrophota bacterium]
MKKLLLHVCCAPCMIYPLEVLRGKGYEVSGIFYNPNIHTFAEYNNRKTAVEAYAKVSNTEVIFPQYLPQEYFQAVNLKEDKPKRCGICWEMRLSRTAKAAKEKGLEYFTSTLLVSPYQDQELLKKIGEEVSKQEQVGFYYEDFRPGFRKAHNQAHVLGIYCQKFCGCIYSEIERCSKS